VENSDRFTVMRLVRERQLFAVGGALLQGGRADRYPGDKAPEAAPYSNEFTAT